jgi:hypothetical protein
MNGVRIDSGIDPLARLEFVPPEKWADLVLARWGYILHEFTRDCRKLVEWVSDAEELWGPLGYGSADDLIRRGYNLEPEEIRLVARWLELNDPDTEVGLEEAKSRAQQMAEAARATTGEVRSRADNQHSQSANATQAERAKEAGISKRQQEKLDALARRAPELLARVRTREMSTHRACVEAGIVKVPTPLEKAKRAVERLTEAEGRELAAWLSARFGGNAPRAAG